MIATNSKSFIETYWNAISGQTKTKELISKFTNDPELIGHIETLEQAFPKYEMIADDVIVEDDRVVVRAHALGVHRGDLMGIPPTGKSIDIPFCAIYKVKDDMIMKSWIFYDSMVMMTQLGLNNPN